MLHLKEGPNQPGLIFSTLYICLFIKYSLLAPIYIRPRIFLFSRPHFPTHIHDPIPRLTFTTHIHDSHFATQFRDPHSRPTFHDSTRDSLSRLTFATPLATPISDSRLRLHSRLTFTTPDRAPNCDSLFFVATSVVQLHH